MIGHENGAGQGENAAAGTGGSVAEHHSPEATNSGVPNSGAVPAAQAEDGDSIYTPSPVSRKPLGCLVEIAETLILTIVIFWLIQTFVAQPYRVEQQSMETTLLPDQYVLVDKLTPRFDSFSRGDIVVFNPVIRDGACTNPVEDPSQPPPTPYIKRVIGEPGDKVSLQRVLRSRPGDPSAERPDELDGRAGSPLRDGRQPQQLDRLSLGPDRRDLPDRCDRPGRAALLAVEHDRHPADTHLPAGGQPAERSASPDSHSLALARPVEAVPYQRG